MPRDPLKIWNIGAFTASSAWRRAFPLVLISCGHCWALLELIPQTAPFKSGNVFSQHFKCHEIFWWGKKRQMGKTWCFFTL